MVLMCYQVKNNEDIIIYKYKSSEYFLPDSTSTSTQARYLNEYQFVNAIIQYSGNCKQLLKGNANYVAAECQIQSCQLTVTS